MVKTKPKTASGDQGGGMASAQELIRSLHVEEGVSEKDIAKRLGLSVQAVRDVLEQPPARRRPPEDADGIPTLCQTLPARWPL